MLYSYHTLETCHNTRLLQVIDANSPDPDGITFYRLIHAGLPESEADLDFEAVSYTWGSPERIEHLIVDGEGGTVGLTANLSEALPI